MTIKQKCFVITLLCAALTAGAATTATADPDTGAWCGPKGKCGQAIAFTRSSAKAKYRGTSFSARCAPEIGSRSYSCDAIVGRTGSGFAGSFRYHCFYGASVNVGSRITGHWTGSFSSDSNSVYARC